MLVFYLFYFVVDLIDGWLCICCDVIFFEGEAASVASRRYVSGTSPVKRLMSSTSPTCE